MLGHYISNSLRDYLVFLVAGKITLIGGKPLDLQKLQKLSKDISDTFCSFLNRCGFFHFVLDIFILEKRIYISNRNISKVAYILPGNVRAVLFGYRDYFLHFS